MPKADLKKPNMDIISAFCRKLQSNNSNFTEAELKETDNFINYFMAEKINLTQIAQFKMVFQLYFSLSRFCNPEQKAQTTEETGKSEETPLLENKKIPVPTESLIKLLNKAEKLVLEIWTTQKKINDEAGTTIYIEVFQRQSKIISLRNINKYRDIFKYFVELAAKNNFNPKAKEKLEEINLNLKDKVTFIYPLFLKFLKESTVKPGKQEVSNGIATFLSLPPELISEVFSWMQPIDVIKMSRMCRRLNGIARTLPKEIYIKISARDTQNSFFCIVDKDSDRIKPLQDFLKSEDKILNNNLAMAGNLDLLAKNHDLLDGMVYESQSNYIGNNTLYYKVLALTTSAVMMLVLPIVLSVYLDNILFLEIPYPIEAAIIGLYIWDRCRRGPFYRWMSGENYVNERISPVIARLQQAANTTTVQIEEIKEEPQPSSPALSLN